jgi:hypothetical protein
MVFFLETRIDVATCELLDPDRNDTARGDEPWFGGFNIRRDDATTGQFTQYPCGTVKEDKRDDTGDNTISDAE